MLINIAICIFVLAAIGGSFILSAILKDKPTPKPIVLAHGPLAVTGIFLLIIDVVKGHTADLLIASIVIFIIAALGGFTLLTLDMLNKKIPKAVAIMHPLIALCGLAVLVYYAFQ